MATISSWHWLRTASVPLLDIKLNQHVIHLSEAIGKLSKLQPDQIPETDTKESLIVIPHTHIASSHQFEALEGLSLRLLSASEVCN